MCIIFCSTSNIHASLSSNSSRKCITYAIVLSLVSLLEINIWHNACFPSTSFTFKLVYLLP